MVCPMHRMYLCKYQALTCCSTCLQIPTKEYNMRRRDLTRLRRPMEQKFPRKVGRNKSRWVQVLGHYRIRFVSYVIRIVLVFNTVSVPVHVAIVMRDDDQSYLKPHKKNSTRLDYHLGYQACYVVSLKTIDV